MTSTATLKLPRKPSIHKPSVLTCNHCGAELSHSVQFIAEDAQRRILELEAQVRILTSKATSAADKLADYEDTLGTLHTPLPAPSETFPQASSSATSNLLQAESTLTRPPLSSRLSYLLPTRRSTSQPPLSAPASKTTHGTPIDPSNDLDLLTALTHEQSLRRAAENRISQTDAEIEELSAQLFQEANEMVANERKARAKLEERVRILEGREGERMKRMEVLEGRVGRIDRVRLLLDGVGSGVVSGGMLTAPLVPSRDMGLLTPPLKGEGREFGGGPARVEGGLVPQGATTGLMRVNSSDVDRGPRTGP